MPIPVWITLSFSLRRMINIFLDTRYQRRPSCRSRISRIGFSGTMALSHVKSWLGMLNSRASSRQKANLSYVALRRASTFDDSFAPRCRYSCPHYLRRRRKTPSARASSSHYPAVDPTSLRSIVHVMQNQGASLTLPLSCQHSSQNRHVQMRICEFQRPHLGGTSSGIMGQWARLGRRASWSALGTE
jgi:hypothetical protein